MQQVDARLNEYTGSLDIIGGQTFTDTRTAGATISATNGELLMDLHGKAVAVFEIRSAANAGTYVFEGTIDGTNYFALPARPMPGSVLPLGTPLSEALLVTVTVATTIAASFAVSATGYRRVRCRSSLTTSGSAVVTGRATNADYAIIAVPQPTMLWVTATAAANTIVTATLPAVAGMFHYITTLLLMRNATAALAGTATLIHTTTNLPGTPAFSVGNAMVAGGTQTDVSLTFANPLKSSVVNTATTVVMPAAGAAVLNRVNVGYYLGA